MTSKAICDTDPGNVKKPSARQREILKRYLPDYKILMDDTTTDEDIEREIEKKLKAHKKKRKSTQEILDNKK